MNSMCVATGSMTSGSEVLIIRIKVTKIMEG